jgi:hypothetical protein
MALIARLRPLGFLALALVSLTSAAQAQFALVLEPKVIEVASTVTLTVTSNGAINLSGITAQQVSFIEFAQGVGVPSDVGTRKVDATARRLIVTASLADATRVIGERQMNINFGDVIVSFRFTLVPPFVCPASCQPPRMCVNKICVLPPSKCNPRCQPPKACNEARRRCEIPR